MSLFTVNHDEETMSKSRQSLSGGKSVLKTDWYLAKIVNAFFEVSKSSPSQSLTIVLEIDGKDYKFQQWYKDKNGKTTYTTAKAETKNLPDYVLATDLARLTVNSKATLNDLANNTVDKIIKNYDGSEITVSCVTSIIGKEIGVLIAEESDSYVKTDKMTGEQTVVPTTKNRLKAFTTKSKKTVVEAVDKTEPKVIEAFLNKFQHQVMGGNKKTPEPSNKIQSMTNTGSTSLKEFSLDD